MADYIRPTGLLSEDEEKQLLDQYYAPKARPSTGVRRKGNPVDSANLPVDVLRGRIAGLLGLAPDVLNFMGRSPLPIETFGETQYTKSAEVPYGSEYWLKTLPLAPTSRAGQVAGEAASFVPLNPVPIGRAATAAVRATKGLPVGASIRQVAPQEAVLSLAQERAIKLGQSASPEARMLQQGYEPGWYHGTTGDITRFRSDLLGETTGAQSAKKGFFFARDPQNPPEAMLKKSNDPASTEMLRKLGIPEDEIAKLNTVSMQGHGSETASGYASIGGSREYKEAMRKASAAEKRGDWSEYEKQTQIAEDAEIGRSQTLQGLVAQYGDVRDEMLDAIQSAIYSKKLPQDQAELLDQRVKQLMPYGWYNSYSNPQLEALKREIVDLVGEDSAKNALGKITRFQSVKNERNLMERTQEGGNVMPVSLRYEKPMVYDFEGKPYRDQTYSDLVDQALSAGNDALILKNTYDPGGGPAKLIDVGVVFNPNQIRSRFAAFDPTRKNEPDLLAGALPFTALLDEENRARLEEQLGGLLGP